jgi:hypothetical protein
VYCAFKLSFGSVCKGFNVIGLDFVLLLMLLELSRVGGGWPHVELEIGSTKKRGGDRGGELDGGFVADLDSTFADSGMTLNAPISTALSTAEVAVGCIRMVSLLPFLGSRLVCILECRLSSSDRLNRFMQLGTLHT